MPRQESASLPGADAASNPSAGAAAAATTSSSLTSHPASPNTAAAAAAAAAANKTRRSHRKSRNGCAECKRRHIRCDEHRPLCANCVSADRTCVYPRGLPAAVTAAALSSVSPYSSCTGAAVSNSSRRYSHHSVHHQSHSHPHPPPPPPHHQHPPITSPHQLSSPGASAPSINGNASTPSPSHHPSTALPPRHDVDFAEVCGPLPRPGSAAASATTAFRRSNYTYYPNANSSSIDTSAPPTPQASSYAAIPGGAPPSPASLTADAPTSASIFTPLHLQLFHHMQTVMIPDQSINTNNYFQQIIDIAMRHVVDAPYLINELLALSAVHMATVKENQLQLQQQQHHQHPYPEQHQYDGSTSTTPASTRHPSLPPHAPAVLPPLLPPHSSPSSTSSPAPSTTSLLPSMSASATSPRSISTATTTTTTSSSTTSPFAASNPIVANLRHQATELQTRAVANFTRLTAHLEPDDTATCIPRFLFSSVLSMHALADSLAELRAANANFHGFIDRFVDCFNLYRGIRAVIYPTWQFLSDSELRPLLQITREASRGIVERGNECEPLRDLLCRSDLAPTSLHACRVAVDKLQWAFDLHNNLPPQTGQHAVSAFSVIVSAEYVDVLRKHRPEALIILSYFAVLLHRCRQFWIFQNSGASMIKAIANNIGSYWRDAMAWPLQVIENEDCDRATPASK